MNITGKKIRKPVSILTKFKTSINRSRKRNSKQFFLIHILRWRGFLIIPPTTLYDEYIDRSKLSEQNNPSWVYSHSPLKRGRNNKVAKEKKRSKWLASDQRLTVVILNVFYRKHHWTIIKRNRMLFFVLTQK